VWESMEVGKKPKTSSTEAKRGKDKRTFLREQRPRKKRGSRGCREGQRKATPIGVPIGNRVALNEKEGGLRERSREGKEKKKSGKGKNAGKGSNPKENSPPASNPKKGPASQKNPREGINEKRGRKPNNHISSIGVRTRDGKGKKEGKVPSDAALRGRGEKEVGKRAFPVTLPGRGGTQNGQCH